MTRWKGASGQGRRRAAGCGGKGTGDRGIGKEVVEKRASGGRLAKKVKLYWPRKRRGEREESFGLM